MKCEKCGSVGCSFSCVQQQRDELATRVVQLERARGASHCGYQWGMGATNHGGGCERLFNDCDETFRCLTCGGVFHKWCLLEHFKSHSGRTVEAAEAERDRLATRLAEAHDLLRLARGKLYAVGGIYGLDYSEFCGRIDAAISATGGKETK